MSIVVLIFYSRRYLIVYKIADYLQIDKKNLCVLYV